jgi:hypothetical protein
VCVSVCCYVSASLLTCVCVLADKRKVEALKSENDRLVKEAARQNGTPGTAPRMMKTVRTGQASKQSPAPLRDGERDLATAGSTVPREDDADTPVAPTEDHNKKRQLTAISTSTRVQRSLFTPYASPAASGEEVDVREIQERYSPSPSPSWSPPCDVWSVLMGRCSRKHYLFPRRLRRRSLSKRILDRLAYWENMQQRQSVPIPLPSPLGSKSSGLASRGTKPFCPSSSFVPLSDTFAPSLRLSAYCRHLDRKLNVRPARCAVAEAW